MIKTGLLASPLWVIADVIGRVQAAGAKPIFCGSELG